MKNKIFFLALLLIVSFTGTVNAAMKDRLVPITSGKMKVAVDSFILGTQDRFIATIVRDLDEESLDDIGDTMRDMAARYENKNLALVERLVFDKNAKKVGMLERYMTPADDLQTRLSIEPMPNADLLDVTPGTLGAILWDKIAGPNGLGNELLGDDPAPVQLALDTKYPTDEKRYVPIVKPQIGGMFLDKQSIATTAEGCSALILESFDYENEVHFGGMAMQYTGQAYIDASYAVSRYEFFFENLAQKRVRFTKFSADGKVIYSCRLASDEWVTVDIDPMVPYVLLTLRANLPENVEKALAKSLAGFDDFMKASIEEAKKEQAAKEAEEAQNTPPTK